MGIVESLITFLHIIVCIIVIIAVLLQPGKSGDLGSMFGGGTSESVFGSSGAVPFLAKLTRILGVVFFATSLSLGYFAIRGNSSSVLEGVGAPTLGIEAPADSDTLADPAGTDAADAESEEFIPAVEDKTVENKTEGAADAEALKEAPAENNTEKQE